LLLSIVITLYDYTTFQFGYSFHWLCMCWWSINIIVDLLLVVPNFLYQNYTNLLAINTSYSLA
jgi:hypothetical protein